VSGVIYGIVIVQELFSLKREGGGWGQMTWMVTQDAEYSVECQTSMSTFGVFIFKQKKSGRKCPAPSLDFCYVPSLPLTQKKNRVPTIGGGLLYIYKFYSFLRRYNFFFFSKKVYNKVGRARWNLGIWFLLLFFFSGLLLYMGGCPVYMLTGLQVEVVQADT
jgi:hypothetical protein